MELRKIYFYTATILEWKLLLEKDNLKQIIINSLQYLSENKLLNIYGFVIMPNHIHLIWESLRMNGKEMPHTHTSFMKFTAHEFKNTLQKTDSNNLNNYRVDEITRDYRFWQRDSLAIELYSREVIEQKLDYIHANPVQEKWNLCKVPVDYKYSSASFYESGSNNFRFLKHFMDRI